MITRLNESDHNLDLENPANREILQAFWKSEFDRMDESVYTPLEKRYSSLKEIINGFRDDYDPILAHESDKSIMGIYRLIGGFAGIASFFLESKSPQKTRMIVDKIDSLSELYNQSIPVKEYFYRSIIGAAKEIGSLRGVEAVELFEDPDYSDCVQGKAFLMRPLAEKLLEVSQICERSVFDLQRCSREFIKNNCNITGDQFEYDYIIPTPEAVDTLHSAVKKYKSGEFKRIYSRYIL